MKRPTVLLAAAVVACWLTPSGRAAESPLDAAALAWEHGDYVAALTTYLQVLDSPDADAALETIALQTGELYRTTEITADGAVPRFSSGGDALTYETGPQAARVIRLLKVEGLQLVAEFPGRGGAFSPDGSKLAYVKVTTGADAQSARTAIVVRDVATGTEVALDTMGLRAASPVLSADGSVIFAGTGEPGAAQLYSAAEGRPARPLTTGPGDKTPLEMNATGTALLYSIRTGAGRGAAGAATAGRGGGGGTSTSFGLLSIADGKAVTIAGTAPSFSRDGRVFVYVARDAAENRLAVAPATDPEKPVVVRRGAERLDAPALSRDGSRIAFQVMPYDDWEIHVIDRDGTREARVTREIQHDVLPKFITADRLVAATGEPRHRRSSLYDLGSMKRTRIFHNNTVRTIAPEYEWVASPDGTKLLVVAERDGDTVSPERGVYLVDLARTVTVEELRARVRGSLDAEQALRARGQKMFAPIAAAVRQVVGSASIARVYGYEKRLFDFDSKHVTQPGNEKAAAYLFDTYESFGYTPEYQRFDYRGRGGETGQTANVIAVLKGTVNPELVYVVSSHYDSTAVGPGADDDSSGTAALLETARVLAAHPQPATIVFASFTGEEAGLLGSREFVRRAVADKLQIVGALNNDMIGWSHDYRLDNTIRYSNDGIRDVQHAAAMQFTGMITYDSRYYKSTDAAAYYEAYGDIVGGIGSYPVLGNPHYHQPHDLLETINHQLVTEVAKTTSATLMLLASSPSRVPDLAAADVKNGSVMVSWSPSREKGVTGYVVSYGPAAKPLAQRVRVATPSVTLKGVSAGMVVAVKAVNAKGLEGWDSARLTLK